MQLTRKAIFWKCWLWSLIVGLACALFFWMVSSVANFFRGPYAGTIFVDSILVFSIVGSYLGAGLVGWRITDKYYHTGVALFVKEYRKYSIISFIVLVGVIYSPLSFLALLWSLLAPWCVLVAIGKAKETSPIAKPKRSKRRQ